jgi:hypothetical protein
MNLDEVQIDDIYQYKTERYDLLIIYKGIFHHLGGGALRFEVISSGGLIKWDWPYIIVGTNSAKYLTKL